MPIPGCMLTLNVLSAVSFAMSKGGWPSLIPALVAMTDSGIPVKAEMAFHVLAILPHQVFGPRFSLSADCAIDLSHLVPD